MKTNIMRTLDGFAAESDVKSRDQAGCYFMDMEFDLLSEES